MEYPCTPFSFKEVTSIHKTLVESGADIRVINQVRSLCSEIKAGRCLSYFNGAQIYEYIASDIPDGDDLWTSSSIFHYQKFKAPEKFIKKTFKGRIREKLLNTHHSPKIASIETQVLLNPSLLKKLSDEFFIEEEILFFEIENEFPDVCYKMLEQFKENKKLISFDEINIPLNGEVGLGGRNSHFVLYMAKLIFEDNYLHFCENELRNIHLGSYATDGDDGNSSHAGAYFNYELYQKAKSLKLNMMDFLSDFNSANFFKTLNCTYQNNQSMNLMDVRFLIRN